MLPDAMDERAKIVQYLRDKSDCFAPEVEAMILRLAGYVERGEHDYIDLPRIKLGPLTNEQMRELVEKLPIAPKPMFKLGKVGD